MSERDERPFLEEDGACPSCGHIDGVTQSHAVDRRIGLAWSIDRCATCGWWGPKSDVALRIHRGEPL